MERGKRILVPIDFSKGSSQAVEYAVILAKALGGAIELLHVYETPELASTIVPGADVDSDAAEGRAVSVRSLERFRSEVVSKGFSDVTVRAVMGDPTRVILDLVAREPYGLIVMGTHGRTGIGRLLMSSVAEQVVRRAACPVMTVHLPPEPL